MCHRAQRSEPRKEKKRSDLKPSLAKQGAAISQQHYYIIIHMKGLISTPYGVE